MSITISENLTDIVLDDPNTGRQEFFKEIMETLSDRDFGVLHIDVDLPTGVGGFFTDKLYVDSINLSKNACTFEDNKVKFKDDYEFAVFVHEACHFLHLSRDGGLFIAPGTGYTDESVDLNKIAENMKLRRAAEYEAGYRAIMADRAYRMFPGSRVNLEVNLWNMLNYDRKQQSKEYNEKLEEETKDMDKLNDEERKAKYAELMNKLLGHITRFSSWADPKHSI